MMTMKILLKDQQQQQCSAHPGEDFGLTPREVVGMKNENGAAFTRVASRPGPRPFIARSGSPRAASSKA